MGGIDGAWCNKLFKSKKEHQVLHEQVQKPMAFMGGIFGVYGEKVLGVLIGNILCLWSNIGTYYGECLCTYYGAIFIKLLLRKIRWVIMHQKYGSCYYGKYGLFVTENMYCKQNFK